MSDSPLFSILIPTHNRRDLLCQTLKSLTALEQPSAIRVELIVIANACSDDTADLVAGFAENLPFPVRCVAEPRIGLSAARNRGLREAAGAWVAFFDDDLKISPQWLIRILEVFETHKADIVGGRIELWWGAVERPAWLGFEAEMMLSRLDHGPSIHRRMDAWVYGGNLAMRREVFVQTGDFREDLGRKGAARGAGEENDFVMRATDRGFIVYYAPAAQVDHWVAPDRLTPEYLYRAAIGNGQSYAIQTGPDSRRRLPKEVARYVYRFARHGFQEAVGRLRGDTATRIDQLIRRGKARGALTVTLRKLFSRAARASEVDSQAND